MTDASLAKMSIASLSKLIGERQVSPAEVLEACLDRTTRLDPQAAPGTAIEGRPPGGP